MKHYWSFSLTLLAMVCGLLGSSSAQQDIEAAAKLAYARLSFATQAGAIEGAVTARPDITYEELMKIVAAEAVTFEVHILSSGNVAKIANTPYSKLVSQPAGENVIEAVQNLSTYENSDQGIKMQSFNARVKWIPGMAKHEEWDMPFADLMRLSDAEQKRTPSACHQICCDEGHGNSPGPISHLQFPCAI